MRTRGLIAVALLAAALSAPAATPAEFYLGMLQKGIAHYDAGRFDAAASPLRIAAFGFVDSIQHYQTAQVYLALTYDRLNDADQARRAARAVVTSERIDPRYASLPIPAAIRSAFDAVAKKYLAAADLNVFSAPAVQPPPARPQPAPVQTATQTPVQTPVEKKPEPAAPKPQTPAANSVPKTAETTTKPATTKPATTKPATTTTNSAVTPPAPKPAAPKPAQTQPQTTTAAPATTTPAKPAINVPARFTSAEEALGAARLADARAIYRDLLDNATLSRADLLRVAEGFYRARDFAHTLRAFDRLGPVRRGEEPYRYYVAVSLYETGQYTRARQELAAVLPYIEITPDVARYKSKIEGAAN